MLEIKNLTKIYRTKGGADVRALDDVSMTFGDTGMVFLLGKSGSGKSTLLNLIGGLDRPDGGEIIVKGRGSKTFSTSDFDSYRNTFVGFIFQEYNILNEFTVEDNIALALELQGKPKDKAKIAEILRSVEMEQFAKRKPNTLSGGQKQRIAIARALVKEPEIIMADEPTGALDSATGKQVFDTLKKLSESKLVIVVSHDREFAEIYGDRIVELKDGRIISDVTKCKVAAESASENVSYIGENTISVKSGAKLTPQDMKNIEKFLLSAQSDVLISNDRGDISAFRKQARIDENGAREQFFATQTDKIERKKYTAEESRFIRSKLPLRHAIKIGASSMKVKPFRLFFTIFLTFIAFTMFGLFSTLMLFNEQKTVSESLMMSQDDYVIARKNYYVTINSYINGELQSSYESYEGGAFKQREADDVWDNLDKDAVFTFNYSQEYYSDPEFSIYNAAQGDSEIYKTTLKGFAITAEDSIFRSQKILWGKYPDASDELMISDYTFEAIRKGGKLYYIDENGQKAEHRVEQYSDLEDAVIYLNNSYGSGDILSHPYKVSGVYEAQAVPEEYTSENADGNLGYKWESELNGGFYAYAIVDDSFYDANADYLSHDYGNQTDVSEYFIYFNLPYHIESNGIYTYVSGGQKLPVESGFKQFNVYGLDGTRLNSLSGNGIAYEAQSLGNVIMSSVSNYIGMYDTDGSISEEWSKDDGDGALYRKLDWFVQGICFGISDETFELTDAERIGYLAEVMEFVDKYDIPVFENSEMYSDTSDMARTAVTIEGFYFGGNDLPDRIYCGSDIYDMVLRQAGDIWTSRTETKYDATGDMYSRAVFIKDASTINSVVEKTVLTEDDGSFYEITNSVVNQLSSYISLIDVLSQVFLYVGIALAAFSMLLLFNFISVSIVSKKKEIGILRAVGARSVDVFKIFYSETVIITAICLVLALIVSVLLCSVFNSMIAAELGMPLALFVFGPLSVVIMIGIAILTSVISTFMPVYSIAKKRPVESIRAL